MDDPIAPTQLRTRTLLQKRNNQQQSIINQTLTPPNRIWTRTWWWTCNNIRMRDDCHTSDSIHVSMVKANTLIFHSILLSVIHYGWYSMTDDCCRSEGMPSLADSAGGISCCVYCVLTCCVWSYDVMIWCDDMNWFPSICGRLLHFVLSKTVHWSVL
jgi:hypothetical protein